MSHWRALWIIGAALLRFDQCEAFYVPPALYQLAAGSDLVVLGRIVALDESTFTLSVEEVLAGTTAGSLVQVSRFQDWACAQRWEPYAIGQREIAFLRDDESGYRTNSAGAEGEWQVIGKHVECAYLRTQAIPNPPMILPLRLVASALKDFAACFDVDRKRMPPTVQGGIQLSTNYREVIVERCGTEQIEALATRSEMHKYLVKTLRAAQK